LPPRIAIIAMIRTVYNNEDKNRVYKNNEGNNAHIILQVTKKRRSQMFPKWGNLVQKTKTMINKIISMATLKYHWQLA